MSIVLSGIAIGLFLGTAVWAATGMETYAAWLCGASSIFGLLAILLDKEE